MILTEENEDSSRRREEFRGLFALGVVAVLAVVEASPQSFEVARGLVIQLPFTNQSFTFPLSNFFNLIIFSWIGYAMLMIFAYSDDLLPSKRFRKALKILGLGLLLMGPFLFGALTLIVLIIVYSYAYYPQSLYVIVAVPIVYTVILILLAFKSRYRIRIERKIS